MKREKEKQTMTRTPIKFNSTQIKEIMLSFASSQTNAKGRRPCPQVTSCWALMFSYQSFIIVRFLMCCRRIHHDK